MHRPFTLAEARAAGLSRKVLAGKSWKRLGRGLYSARKLREEPLGLLIAWRNLLPPDAVFIGATAAWLHGLDVDPVHPAEVAVLPGSTVRSRRNLVVRNLDLSTSEVTSAKGLRATTPARTLADLRKRLPRVEFLVLADAALKLGLGRFDEHAEPAESPMETRLRWLLITAGLPRPQAQIALSFGRADLYYPDARLVVEYDGANHRDRLVEDNRRQNLLQNAGYRVLRFTAADLAQRPDTIVGQVRDALIR
jgi:very-short-patch-repair endonuclease